MREILNTRRQSKVRFEADLSTDESDYDSDQAVTEGDEKDHDKQQSSSECGILGRIHKRKMPVRRPTGYVPSKSSSRMKDKTEDREPPVIGSQETSNRTGNLEKRLDQLSLKYKHDDRSPQQYDRTSLTEASREVDNK
ncbi:hypothetical protein KIN20_032848 [Parelaphostrongylus tenuis]|uniref:Uncharacterized protein n=1 Tax=Parelaphostrongylus tenuis TaxID=148309 RepID=A0AAD5R7M7_PARTN|nr:hypothetical protein KIN20_032848 [Parelaphostrongylus tenuis]